MKRFLLISTISVFFFSCNNSPKELQGIWISSYLSFENDTSTYDITTHLYDIASHIQHGDLEFRKIPDDDFGYIRLTKGEHL